MATETFWEKIVVITVIAFNVYPRTFSSGLILQDRCFRRAVNGREIVERHERDVFHENLAAGGFLVFQ